MKGFFIEVSNDLLDPKHQRQMGEAVWLFMWFLDKITVVTQERGKVLGGKPIKFKDIETDLGISRSTYMRWLDTLKQAGYVTTVRTPYGNCIVVMKAKKRFGKTPKDVSEMTQQKEVSSVINETTGSVINETTGSVINETTGSVTNDTSLSRYDTSLSRYDTSNKTRAVDSTVDTINIIDPSGPTGGVTGEDSVTISDQSDGLKLNKAIGLFQSILPGDFIGAKTAFAKPPTREAVAALLARYSLSEIKTLITKYDEGKTDQYRPHVGTVYEFCTTKLAKVEAFVETKMGKLWAHRSISTPEQRADSDARIQRIIERGREKTRRAKEEWLKTHPEQTDGF
ncbi:MAG: hypothetical protein NUV96_02165 [Candidatus Colwellbacteria bacterium]|nr:hypothetical protein [Candidatus Colwellbacteria bacterium]